MGSVCSLQRLVCTQHTRAYVVFTCGDMPHLRVLGCGAMDCNELSAESPSIGSEWPTSPMVCCFHAMYARRQ
jgi:hypothetical protein